AVVGFEASMTGNVLGVQPEAALATKDHHAEARAWVRALRDTGSDRERAAARLHQLLLRAARFELSRRRGQLHEARGEPLDDLAVQSADNALSAILTKLDDYRF